MSERARDFETNAKSARRARGLSRRGVVVLASAVAVAMALGGFAMAANLYGQTQVNQPTSSGYDGNGVADVNLPNTPTLALVQAPADMPGCTATGSYAAAQATPLVLSAIGDDEAACSEGAFPTELWTITPATTLTTETVYLNYTTEYSETGATNSIGGGSIVLSFTAGANPTPQPILLYIVFGNVGNGGSIQSLNLYWT